MICVKLFPMPKRIWFLLALALLTACSPAADPEPTPIPELPSSPTPEPLETPTPVFASDPFDEGMLARRNGNYPRAIAAFLATLNANPAPDLAAEAQYRLGEAYWLNNDPARAINALNAYLQANSAGAHAPETHYLLADAYRAHKDYPSALEQLRLYRDQSPTLVGDTDAAIADLLILAGDSDGALAQYDRALQDTTLTNSARVNILLRLADAHQGRGEPARAAARYDAALPLAADARTKADLLLRAGDAYAAANQLDAALARWGEAITKYPEQRAAYQSLINRLNRGGAVDEFQRGVVDYYAAAYDPAIAAFLRYLQNAGAPRVGDARYFLASAYARKGASTQAIAEYDKIIKSLPKDARVPDAYFGKATAYAALGKTDDAVAVYKKFATTFPEHARADDALWNAALWLDRAQRYSAAAALYEELRAKYPTRDRAAEALFWAGLDHYRGKDFKTASARWQTLVTAYPQTPFYSRALFWLGKAAQGRGLAADAQKYWTQAAALDNGYYSWRAKELLAPMPANITYDLARYAMDDAAERLEFENWLAGWTQTSANGALDPATQADLRFRRGAELLRLDRTVEARRELAGLIEAKKQDAAALYALALYLRENNQFSLALDCAEKIARLAGSARAPAAPRWLWRWRYPTYYADLVVAEAKTNNVDPRLYFALIRQESSFNPWATSSADARGLAQIIPSTGRDIAQRLRVTNFSLDQLYLPYVSVRFGVWYFAQEWQRYKEPIYTLAAYNAGGSRVARWQRSDLDLAVEEIDIAETALYIRTVYSNWKQYQQVYP